MSNTPVQQITAPIDVSQKSIFSNVEKFEQCKYMADFLATSDMVPKEYQKKPANVLIALSMAERMRADPMMVMQNLVIIHGRPSWSSQFLIACVNSSPRFSELEFEEEAGETETVKYSQWYQGKETVKNETVKNDKCRAFATNTESGKVVFGPWISVEMAVKEGWYSKNGSKWKTLPQLMLQYRAAAFFVRTKAPELALGMHTEDEVIDMGPAQVVYENEAPTKSEVKNEIKGLKKKETEKEKQTPKKEEADKKPEPEQQVGSADEIDQLKSIKGFIDLSTTLEALKAVGENIKEMIDDDELSEFEIKESRDYLAKAMATIKNG